MELIINVLKSASKLAIFSYPCNTDIKGLRKENWHELLAILTYRVKREKGDGEVLANGSFILLASMSFIK